MLTTRSLIKPITQIRSHCSFTLLLIVTALASQRAALAADWPQFLGPNRNGISSETKLIDTLPPGGPKEVWRIKGGAGMSGLVVSKGKLVTMWQRAGKQSVVVLDAKTGKLLQDVAIGGEYRNGMGVGPRATPTIVGDVAYAFSGEGILLAVDINKGTVIWKSDVLRETDGREADYGMSSSPLVVDDVVIVAAGAPGAAVVGYDRKSGKLAWQAGNGSAGYSSAANLKVGGREQVVAYTGAGAMGLAAKSGDVLWRFPYKTDFDCNIATPLAYKGQVFISSGENHGCALLGLEPSGQTFDVETVWKSNGPSSVMRNEWQTSILLDGHLYGMDNVGGAGPITNLNCVDIATGKRVWQERRFGKGNLIAADGKLWISTMKGDLVVVRASPKGFDELGRAKVIDGTRQAPALVGGLLFLRDDSQVVCLDIRK